MLRAALTALVLVLPAGGAVAGAPDTAALANRLAEADQMRSAIALELAQANDPLGQSRMTDLEAALRRLTGEIEQMQFELRTLKDRQDRFERDVQYRLLTLENGGVPPADLTPPPSSPDAGIPGPSSLPPATSQDGFGPEPGTPVPLGPSLPQGELGQLAVTGPTGGASDLYDQGMEALSRAQYGPALAAFREIVSRHPDSEEARQARFWIADIQFVQKNFPEAARGYADMLKSDPDSPRAPDAMLKLGLSLLQMGQSSEGCTTLAALPQKYPNAGETLKQRARREAQRGGCR